MESLMYALRECMTPEIARGFYRKCGYTVADVHSESRIQQEEQMFLLMMMLQQQSLEEKF